MEGNQLSSPTSAPADASRGRENVSIHFFSAGGQHPMHLSQLPTGRHMWHVDESLQHRTGSAGLMCNLRHSLLSRHMGGCIYAEARQLLTRR